MNEQIRRFIYQEGLLNVPLFHNQTRAMERYALLNGSTNNLCVDAEPWMRDEDYKGYAWSTGNNNYLLFENETTFTEAGLVAWLQRAIQHVIDQYSYQVNKGRFESCKNWL